MSGGGCSVDAVTAALLSAGLEALVTKTRVVHNGQAEPGAIVKFVDCADSDVRHWWHTHKGTFGCCCAYVHSGGGYRGCIEAWGGKQRDCPW